MRLDVAVNMLTMQALTKGEITVLGGDQTRPNIHIDDITDLYLFLLERPQTTGIFNAGFENLSILEIANRVVEVSGAKIVVKPSNDPRSYRVNSEKILAAGFRPKKSVKTAIDEISEAFKTGLLKDEDRFHNLKWMQKTLYSDGKPV
jgi:nucleoside-diphosphate-sugar epimerase